MPLFFCSKNDEVLIGMLSAVFLQRLIKLNAIFEKGHLLQYQISCCYRKQFF